MKHSLCQAKDTVTPEPWAAKLEVFKSPSLKESDFTPLFDGKALSGWVGAKKAYRVEHGAIVCQKGTAGNLFTEKEYSNFVLRFEFQLSPGANNGLGIRSPLKGDPAYVGIELQILDNAAEKFAGLQPYQYHGSAYGIAAAKRGALKPVGEWNQQEVMLVGDRLIVTLNKRKILDVNLKKVAPEGKTIDGREHPGLKRTKGHLGFLGHGDEVKFRKIRIVDLGESK
ncbi:MAG: DUF1080 domain-containing protein [Lacipirellulaceae bacterium]